MIRNLANLHLFENCGNKSKNLAILKQNGFPVPDGFVLEYGVFEEILRHNGKKQQITTALSGLAKNNVSEKSALLTEMVTHLKMPPQITEKLRPFIGKKQKYAVRSSGAYEDLPQMSFAGQYETVLNTEGIESILQAMLDCYRSMYSEKNLLYLLDNQKTADNITMSVLVQEMIDAKKSGVIFTVNPLSGNDKEMLLEVSQGLGDALVSGRSKPQKYRYNWFTDTYPELPDKTLLSERELRDVTAAALEIQMLFGHPCDIEFALTKDKLFILQARAVTTIDYGNIKDIWTDADFKDGGISSAPCKTLMWSLYEYAWEITLKKFLLESKLLHAKELRKLSEMFFARGYWNAGVVKKAMKKIPGYKEIDFDKSLGIEPDYPGEGTITKLSFSSAGHILKIILAQNKMMDRREHFGKMEQIKLQRLYESYSTGKENITDQDLPLLWRELTQNDYLLAEGAYFWQIFLNTVHQSAYKSKLSAYVCGSDYLQLLGGLQNISHIQPLLRLWDISRKIGKDQQVYQFWTDNLPEQIAKDYNGQNYQMSEIRRYLQEYGHHSEKELDISYPNYSENPQSLIKQIQETVPLGEQHNPYHLMEKQKTAYKQVLKKVRNQTSPSRYKRFLKTVRSMRVMLREREAYKDLSTKFYHLIRMYTLQLAKLYCQQGILSQENDIWFLRIKDVWEFIDGKSGKAQIQTKIRLNKNYYQSFRNYQPPHEIGGKMKQTPPKTAVCISVLQGVPCGGSIVTGKAKVISGLEELDQIKENDILVTKFTDTGWTGKFAMLKGIVTEYGGVLCHAAVISREYGLTCIVNVEDAVKKIKNGDTLTINGHTGEIHIKSL